MRGIGYDLTIIYIFSNLESIIITQLTRILEDLNER